MKFANAFSISMVSSYIENSDYRDVDVKIREVTQHIVSKELKRLGVESYIGHADTALILSGILDVDIPINRGSLTIEFDESIFVAQYSGPRLPEGSTQLPEGASFKFYEIWVR